ncbi:MAG: hypothetical protein KGH58_03390 [Candidatus Micrarchaeota archaeon]|nr:hypothetical protein [Candidatus Micrarchaeota archaeon]
MSHNSSYFRDEREGRIALLKATIKVLKAIEGGTIMADMRAGSVRGLTLAECEPALNHLAQEGKIRLDIDRDPAGAQKLRAIEIVDRRFAEPLLRIDDANDSEVRECFNRMYSMNDLGNDIKLR